MSLTLGRPIPGPHGDAKILVAGAPPAEARRAVVLCHGRGGAAEEMLTLARELDAEETAFVAPQAAGATWYPLSFLATFEENEPHLSSALALVGAIVEALEREGIPAAQQMLLGFSQGGCLALELARRAPRRYGAVVGLSAGLIGPPGTTWSYPVTLEGTPIFLGCSDRDPHIPEERLEASARELERAGAEVTLEIYRGLGHTVNRDELDRVQRMLDGLAEKGR